MLISEAKTYLGYIVDITYTDRSGKQFCQRAEVFDVGFVPLMGPCLITDAGELRLDRVLACYHSQEQHAA